MDRGGNTMRTEGKGKKREGFDQKEIVRKCQIFLGSPVQFSVKMVQNYY